MAITEITAKTLGKKKSGWRFDRKRELYVTFAVDTTFDGARHVKRGFLTERAAQDYIDQLKIQDRLKQIGVREPIKYPRLKELFEKRLKDIDNYHERTRAMRVFKKFLKIAGKDITIDKITKNHYKQFADARLKELSKNRKTRSESKAIKRPSIVKSTRSAKRFLR